MRARTIIAAVVAIAIAALVGAVYLVAAGDDDQRRAGALSRTYVAGTTVLLSEGKSLGSLKSASCGGVAAQVTRVEPGKAGPDAKQIGSAQWEPCELKFGLSMDPALYGWISEALAGKPGTRNLTLQTLDYEGKELSRLDLNQALLTEFSMPTFDAANTTPAYMNITVKPQSYNAKAGSGAVVSTTSTKTQKTWLPANFRFDFGGLPLSKVSKVSSIGFKVDPGTQRPLLDDFTVVAAQSDLGGLDSFLQKFVIDGVNGPESETTAKLTMLDSTLATTLGTLSFTGVGMTGGELVGATESGSETIAKRQYTLYAEGFSLNIVP